MALIRYPLFFCFCFDLMLFCCLLSACGGNPTEQPQRSFFPIPCMSKAGFYYVDENGERMDALSGELAALGWKPSLNYSLSSGFFKDGLLKVRDVYFLDRNGTLILNAEEVFEKLFGEHAQSAKCSDFSEGIAFVQGGSLEDRTRATAINKKGEVLFELEGRPLTAFYKGVAYFMTNDGRVGVFNTKGEIIMEPREDIAAAVSEYDRTPPLNGKVSVKNENGLVGAVNFKGKLVVDYISEGLPLNFDQNDCAVFYKDRYYGLIDGKGEVLIEPKYKILENDGDWYYFKTEDDKTGWCDKKGKEKIAPLAEQESAKRGIETSPRPFYGSDYSVCLTSSIINDDYYYSSLAWNVDDYKKGYSAYHEAHGYLIVTPFVNGIAVGLSPQKNTCTLLCFKKNIKRSYITELNDNCFACAWQPGDLDVIGDYVVHPWAYWSGAHD